MIYGTFHVCIASIAAIAIRTESVTPLASTQRAQNVTGTFSIVE